MGCSQSTMENKEAVNQCKERIKFMKQSISAHSAFAAAHSAYAAALKNTGAAFSDYAQLELQNGVDQGSNPIDFNFEMTCRSKKEPSQGNDGIVPWDFFFTSMVEVDDKSSGIGKLEIQRGMADDKSGHGGGEIRSGVVESEEEPPLLSMKEDVESMKLLKVIKELDDGFVKASESAHEVSKIIEAHMLHYDSNTADNHGHIDHSTRVTTWKHLFKGHQIANEEIDNYAPKEKQTLSMILDNILAWEKKLYNEVKAGEEMKYAYKKKVASLNRLTKRGASSDTLVRTKAMVSHIHRRCIVHMQSIDSTISEINRLRDKQLYPKLVQLVKEMSTMWESMGKQHEKQLKMMQELKAIKISQSRNETNERNLINTKLLHVHVKLWCSEFQKLILHQKEYIKYLNSWLKLNLMSIDNNLRDKVSSQQNPQNPKIQSLLYTLQDQLEKLPELGVITSINTFATAMDALIHSQSDEMRMREMCEETRREITRKSRKFEGWCDKQIVKRNPTDENDVDVMDDIELIAEHQIVMEALKGRLEEEEETYRRLCIQVKDKSLKNLKTDFAEIFVAMSEFSCACSHMYGSLKPRSTRRY